MIQSKETEQPIYLNPEITLSERLNDLISHLTLDEKVGLMSHPAKGVPRLGIPAYDYWSEALHGVSPVYPLSAWNCLVFCESLA